MAELEKIKKQLQQFPIQDIKGGFKIEYKAKKLKDLIFHIRLSKLIFPVREGEFIDDVRKLPLNKEYSVSYPGTASTKSMALFVSEKEGVFIGGIPTYEFSKIKIKRIKGNLVKITYRSPEHHLYFYRANTNWRHAADKFKKVIGTANETLIKRKPRYFLQIGIIDSFGNCGINHFDELLPIVKRLEQEIGTGHIVHLFGTNEAGFDRMFPDFTIAKRLGGKKALAKTIKKIKQLGFLTSHHYNPRIADTHWIKKYPGYLKAIAMKKSGELVKEKYKGHAHYVMNPNNERWFQRSMKTVNYLKSIGFDYIQLDQFTYQRNFYNPCKPLHLGYKRMIDEFERLGIKFWLEGVSDIHSLRQKGNFYQILTRDRPQVWEDRENRRGYPHGRSYPCFFMYLYPNAEVSYQIVTENNHVSAFERRLKTAERINAQYYDLQMDFYDQKYIKTFDKIIRKIELYLIESKNKICICHYRIGKTDGVSLEIMKKKKALEKMGYKVSLLSGPQQVGSDYVIPELEFDRKDILKIKENSFFKFKDYAHEDALMKDINDVAEKIKNKFLKINERKKFDILLLHNIFCHGRHIAAAKAFYDISKEIDAQVIGFDHDFYETYGIYDPQTPKVKKYLSKYVPPKDERIKHVTINSLSQKILQKKIKRKSIIFPDMFEFDQKTWEKDTYNKDFLKTFVLKENDLIVLQATRIVERKAIELAVDLVAKLNKRKDELIGKTLYNGKKFSETSDIVLVLPGYTEHASKKYAKELKMKIEKMDVKAKFISSHIANEREEKRGKKIYSLWDTYAYADLITYPSMLEGWGNQFIEAVFAKKPIAIFEYPVFKKDIKKEGYHVISFGDKIVKRNGLVTISKVQLEKTTDQTIDYLTDKKTNELVRENFEIGKKYHGEKALTRLVRRMLLS